MLIQIGLKNVLLTDFLYNFDIIVAYRIVLSQIKVFNFLVYKFASFNVP